MLGETHKLYGTIEGRVTENEIDFDYKNKIYVKHLITEAKKGTF